MESLVGCRLWGRTESDTTEATQQQQQGNVLFPTNEATCSFFFSLIQNEKQRTKLNMSLTYQSVMVSVAGLGGTYMYWEEHQENGTNWRKTGI